MIASSSLNAFPIKLPESFFYDGSLEHQFSYNKVGEASAVTTNISTLRLNGRSFLWRPWLATLNGSLNLSYINRQNFNNSSGHNISGNINLNLFPQSRFPFSAFFKKRNNEVEGDLTNESSTNTSYGFSQGYFQGSSRFNIIYQHLINENESSTLFTEIRSTEDTEDSLEADFSTAFGKHDISARSRFSFIERSSQFMNDEQMLHTVRHNYRPGPTLTMNNLFSLSDRTIEAEFSSPINLRIIQLNSNTFWRPRTKKRLLVTGSALFQGTGDLDDGKFGIFDSMGVSGSANYQWNPFLNLRAQANVNTSEDRTSTEQRAGVEYTPADTELWGFRHAYNLSADIANNTDNSTGNRQELTLQAGHLFNRNYPGRYGNFDVSATQRGSTIINSTGRTDRTLSHTFSTGWSMNTNKTTNFARMTLSDTRRFSSEQDEFGLQLANLQMTSNYNINAASSLNGTVTFQATRTLENDDTGDNIDYNTSVSILYDHARLFGVNRLRLNSEVRYLSNSLFEIANSDGFDDVTRNNVFWQNRLYYDIGLLSLRLTTNIGQANGEFNNFILFQIRRNFGN